MSKGKINPDDKAKNLVVEFYNSRSHEGDDVKINRDDVKTVWFSKVLQNWKGLFITLTPDNEYYEITYNGDKGETYLDAYSKIANVRYPDEENV